MASSGLWENVIPTKTYLPRMTWIYVWHTLVPKGGVWQPHEEDHTYQFEEYVCTPPCVSLRRLGYCGVVTKGYLKWRAGVSCRTSIQMWSSWYIPRFPLRDGSLTQVNMASLLVLVTLCTSLPTMEKQLTLIECPVDWLCLYMGWGGGSKVFCEPVPKGPSQIP